MRHECKIIDLLTMNTTLAEAGALPNKCPIEQIVATVKSSFDPSKQPDRGYGEYVVQNTVLEDETGTIKCGFFDAAVNLKQYLGQQIVITSQNGKGIQRHDYKNKEGTVEHQLKVSKAATIDEVAGGNTDKAAEVRDAGVGHVQNPNPSVVRGGVPKVNYAPDEDKKRESFERQKALESAVALNLESGFSAEEVIATAEKFYAFLSGQGPKVAMPSISPEEAKAQDPVMPEFQDPDEDVL